jgi:hypothetical protein
VAAQRALEGDLASSAVLERSGAEEAARWQLDGTVQLRGRHDATRVAVVR